MAEQLTKWQSGPLKHEMRKIQASLGMLETIWPSANFSSGWECFRLYEDIYFVPGLQESAEPDYRGFAQILAVESILSESQESSLRLLREWEQGFLRPAGKRQQLRSAFLQAIQLESGGHYDGKNERICVYGTTDFTIIMPQDPSSDESPYAAAMLKLWFLEYYFAPRDVNASYLQRLEWQRSECQILAHCHRLAQAVFPGALKTTPRRRALPEGRGVGWAPIPDSSPSTWLPEMNIRNKNMVGFMVAATTSSLTGVVHVPSQARYREILPYYLLDLEAGKTVRSADLVQRGQCPIYVVLNHTWGRWRRKENGLNVSCEVVGVPWPVPIIDLDESLDVRQLPKRLKKLRKTAGNVPYLWIDLFCIPQEDAGPAYATIQKEEVERQAIIFRGALKAYAWLNQETSWRTLEAAVNWFLVDYIDRSQQNTGSRSIADAYNDFFKQELLKMPWEDHISTINSEDCRGLCTALYLRQIRDSPSPNIMATRLDPDRVTSAAYNRPSTEPNPAIGDDSRSQLDISIWTNDFLDEMMHGLPMGSFTGFGTLKALGPGPLHVPPHAESTRGDTEHVHWFTATVEPAGWLSSLWTLQEACLVHDMRLLNKELELPQVGTCGQEVTLRSLCALVNKLNGHASLVRHVGDDSVSITGRSPTVDIRLISPLKTLPWPSIEIIAALAASGLTRVSDIDRVDLLELGTRRTFKGPRGQAVMAAMGVTDWYAAASASTVAEVEQDLVLGLYPYKFIQETIKKAGAVFFASRATGIRHSTINKWIVVPHQNATMLPFRGSGQTGRWRQTRSTRPKHGAHVDCHT